MNNSTNISTPKLSPYALAALLTAARIAELAMYMPSPGENAALTAVTAMGLCLVRLPFMVPAAHLAERLPQRFPRAYNAVMAGLCAAAVFGLAGAFADMMSGVYPERTQRFTLIVVLLAACVYTASMGAAALTRMSCILLWVFAEACIPILIEMRGSMLTDRIDLYSSAPLSEVFGTSRNLLRNMYEPLILMGFLPLTREVSGGRVRAAVKPYLIADCLISCVFFLMDAAVMGRFFGKSGYAFFTLAGSSHGSIIDRASGIFIFIVSSAVLTSVSALMVSIVRFVRQTGDIEDDLTLSAA